MMTWIWLGAVVVFGALEAATAGLVSIWFVCGAVAALLSTFLGAALWLQTALFLVVSAVTLAATRPLVRKMSAKAVPTNLDHWLPRPGDGGHRQRVRHRRGVCRRQDLDRPQQRRLRHPHRNEGDGGADGRREAVRHAGADALRHKMKK